MNFNFTLPKNTGTRKFDFEKFAIKTKRSVKLYKVLLILYNTRKIWGKTGQTFYNFLDGICSICKTILAFFKINFYY